MSHKNTIQSNLITILLSNTLLCLSYYQLHGTESFASNQALDSSETKRYKKFSALQATIVYKFYLKFFQAVNLANQIAVFSSRDQN